MLSFCAQIILAGCTKELGRMMKENKKLVDYHKK
jgi:hypothetical protein